MAQEQSIWKGSIKQGGYWKLSEVYGMLYSWLKDMGYSVSEGLYKESSGDGKEIVIEWEATKKVTDYFKYKITLNWHILRMKDVEVEVEGSKKKMNKGDLGISIKAILVKDYESRWEDKPMNKFLRGIYENYIIKSTVSEYGGNLEGEVTAMVEDLKALLRMGS